MPSAISRGKWEQPYVTYVGPRNTSVIGSALTSVLYGPATRERAKHLNAEQIDQENQAVCAKLSAPYGSEGFATCVEALDEVRRRQADWIAAETAGISRPWRSLR
jgi:hypothetical protein